MSTPRLHLEIEAVWHNNEWWVVGDGDVMLFRLKTHLLQRRPRKQAKCSDGIGDEWYDALVSMRSQLSAAVGRALDEGNPWSRRLKSMASLVNKREPAEKPRKVKHADSWGDRVRIMKANITSRAQYDRTNRDEWTRWSRTAASCGQKRTARRRRVGGEAQGVA